MIELQSRLLLDSDHPVHLPIPWRAADVKLSHRILLRRLTPALLEKWCATTKTLEEAIDKVCVLAEEPGPRLGRKKQIFSYF
jgi:hypothetical protein